jgi:hypothetical protein
MKRINILYILCMAVFLFACEIDNYDAPDAGISGTVIDATTGKGIITEQPNGFQIYYKEISDQYPNAQFRTFWGKADGSFANTKLFASKYEVYPGSGAFIIPDHQTVTLAAGKDQQVNFTVIPYVSITGVSVTKSGSNDINVSFKLTKNAGTILDYRIFATNRTPLVGSEATDGVGGNAVALSDDDLEKTITVTRTGFASGKYWIRVGARCKEAPSSRYNMSEIFEITF